MEDALLNKFSGSNIFIWSMWKNERSAAVFLYKFTKIICKFEHHSLFFIKYQTLVKQIKRFSRHYGCFANKWN